MIINGARQIGKSWSVRELGKSEFDGNFIELNFEKKPQLCTLFDQDLDVKRILQEIALIENVNINKKTLLFFDEIQQCPKAIMALRYFYEDLPHHPIIAAGSLLEFQLKTIPIPVGRVQFMDMFPMNFEEFLIATNNEKLLPYINLSKGEVNDTIEQKIYLEMLNYYWVGGMPACVLEYVSTGNYKEVRKIQEDLLYTYQQDFAKYNPVVNKNCLLDIMSHISQNIGGQVIYSKLSERFSVPTIKKGVEVLTSAKIFTLIHNVSVNALPFSVANKQFKALFIDIGLLLCVSKVAYENLFYNQDLNSNFTGSWAEQFVGQQLLSMSHKPLYYWARTSTNSSAEVDFVIEKNGDIIPIEVKSGKYGKLRSLHLLLKENPNIKKSLVLAKIKPGIEEKIHFQPIYSIGSV
ncbi:MAG TPA: AAA family ATPase [Bacteroidia bacterium]